MMLSAGHDGLHTPPQGTPQKVAHQTEAQSVAMVAQKLAWPALLRKLDRLDTSFRA